MSKITTEELTKWFPAGVPPVIFKLLFPEIHLELTTNDIREICDAYAIALNSQSEEINDGI